MELSVEQIAALRVSPWAPGRCQKTVRAIRAMHPKVIVEATVPLTEEPFRCFMGSGHPGPCCAWGPDGAPWIFQTGA